MIKSIGKYEVRGEIGRGAMGTVYEGFDPAIGRRVAIKTLRTDVFEPSQLADVLARFKREAQSAGRISHPHVVTIHEYGEENGVPYIVMEFMSGKDLAAQLSRGARFQIDEIVRIMSQLLGALAAAHESGVVHRDVKPSNMFLLDDGSLKVVDFGIAHLESSDLTQTGATIGTPAYMSPEQVLGAPVDFRSDLFSSGVVLYQLLTGDRPFPGSAHTASQKILHHEPPPPSSLNPMLSGNWDRVVQRAMAKNPRSRYESARQFSEAIKLALQSESAREAETSRKTAEASEHAYREAVERSRLEAIRRIEAERQVDDSGTGAKVTAPARPWAVALGGAGAIALALALFISVNRSDSPAEPRALQAPPSGVANDATRESERRAAEDKARQELAERTAAEKAASEKAAAERELSDKTARDQAIANEAAVKKAVAAQLAVERKKLEKAGAEGVRPPGSAVMEEKPPATEPAMGEDRSSRREREEKSKGVAWAGAYPFRFANVHVAENPGGAESVLSFLLLYEGGGDYLVGVSSEVSSNFRIESLRRGQDGIARWIPVPSYYFSTNAKLSSGNDGNTRVVLSLKAPLAKGARVPVNFVFKNAGIVSMPAEVR